MTNTYEYLTLDQINIGDKLPALTAEISATTVILGALATRDWRPMHHDKDFAINRNGTKDIFMNTPNQAAWLERFITDWAGPAARLGRYKFRMADSVFPGDSIVFNGEVTDKQIDEVGCGWASLKISLCADDKPMTNFTARVAIPTDTDDNPWGRVDDNWKP